MRKGQGFVTKPAKVTLKQDKGLERRRGYILRVALWIDLATVCMQFVIVEQWRHNDAFPSAFM